MLRGLRYREELIAVERFSKVVNVFKTIDLSHRALFLTSTPAGNVVLVASQEGHVSIINLDSTAVETVKIKSISKISIHPDGNSFASIDQDSGTLQLRCIKGALLSEIEAPEILPGSSRSVRRGFEDCFISESGSSLLASAHVADDLIAVKHFDLQVVNSAVKASHVNTVEIEDPFIGSSCSFYFAGKNLFPLWIAAGQDGQQLCWFGIEGQQLIRLEMLPLQNTTPPVFSPSNDSFAVLDDDNTVCIWSLSPAEQIGSCEAADEDDPFETSMCFVDETHLLASSSEARSFIIDTKSMSVLKEIDDSLCTDFSFFRSIGNSVAFVHRRDSGRGLEGWCDTLTFVENQALLDSVGSGTK
jgi:WD40 repeat protein